MSETEAFISLATNDSYATGALALGKSLRDCGTSRRLALMISPGVSPEMRSRLLCVWDELVDIEELDSGDAEHLALLRRPELGITFSKINAWRLTQYSKCVFLDADTLILQNVDELFGRDELSAAPDIGWPDCFNSGVFVFEPLLETFSGLMELSRQTGSFDGGDQGLLNLYWSDWASRDIKYHLPFTFNVTPNVTYGYAPAFQKFGRNVKIIHFTGSIKPWQHRYLREMDAVILHPGTYSAQNAAQDFIKRWWQVYTSLEQSHLDPATSGSPPTDISHASQPATPTHQQPSQQQHSHHHQQQSMPPAPPLSPNLGGSTAGDHNPYSHVGGWSDYSAHSITPLDSLSQLWGQPGESLRSSGVISEYEHVITPLDSVSQLDSSGGSSELDSAMASSVSISSAHHEDQGAKWYPPPSSSVHYPTSPLSHGDLHSHISLSFYSQNDLLDAAASSHPDATSSKQSGRSGSFHTDDALPYPDQANEVGVAAIRRSVSIDSGSTGLDSSSGSNWSLTHSSNLFPSYHTPLSQTCQPQIPSLHGLNSDAFLDLYWGWGRGHPEWGGGAGGGYESPYNSMASSTECDELISDLRACAPPLPPPTPEGEEEEEEGVAMPDPPSATAEVGAGKFMSCDCHVAMPVPTPVPEGVAEGAMPASDSVLPTTTYPSLSPPLPPPPLPSTTPPAPPPTGVQDSRTSSFSTSELGHVHRREFEVGERYTSFENIQAHIDSILKGRSDSVTADSAAASTATGGSAGSPLASEDSGSSRDSDDK